MNTSWKELAVVVSQSIAELISDKLIEYGSQGTIFETIEELPDHTKILAYYPEETELDTLILHIQHYAQSLQELGENIGQLQFMSQHIDDRDWKSEWKHYFKPTRIGQHLVIKPSWESFEQQSSDLVIEIDPGMAFGTGLHASTRLAAALLEEYMPQDVDVLDVGVGSGILSIAAACLGAQYVLGVDVDAEAVEIARDNVSKNGRLCEEKFQRKKGCIELQVGSLDSLDISREFECIVMNIRPNIIIPLLPYAETFLRTGGAIIISGILEEEGPDLLHEIRHIGYVAHKQRVEDGWIAYVLSKLS
ncbi:hypothetical protein CSA56_06420 [candidate division KSB3 bacterium]|uniref:Ribosomal protein L11 methyltransferase n=1 Tax=candidate division KSB3 bacterium TaxID=2044937 RepID=A0A2G6KGT6_9BACT|nr:MAG: hypothetical protein CSA56_06420 [candidate division KSB3 bacterium]